MSDNGTTAFISCRMGCRGHTGQDRQFLERRNAVKPAKGRGIIPRQGPLVTGDRKVKETKENLQMKRSRRAHG